MYPASVSARATSWLTFFFINFWRRRFWRKSRLQLLHCWRSLSASHFSSHNGLKLISSERYRWFLSCFLREHRRRKKDRKCKDAPHEMQSVPPLFQRTPAVDGRVVGKALAVAVSKIRNSAVDTDVSRFHAPAVAP